MLGLIESFASGKKTNLTAGLGTSGALYGVLSGQVPITAGIGVLLLCALAATLRASLKKIEDKGDHTVITTQSGEKIVAASVIIALPMNVLPNVEFSPALDPALIEADKQKHNGAGIKFYIKAKGGFTKMAKINAMAESSYPERLFK